MSLEQFGEFLDRKVECSNPDELIGLIDEAITYLDTIHDELRDMASSYDESNPRRAAAIDLLFDNSQEGLFLKYNSLLAKAKEFMIDNEVISCACILENNTSALYQLVSDGVLFTETVKSRLVRLKAVLKGNDKIKSIDKSSGCYIATATMGGIDDPLVIALREFKDNCLQQSKYGRMLTVLYYRFSPPLAELIKGSPLLKHFSYWFVVRPAYLFALLCRYNTRP